MTVMFSLMSLIFVIVTVISMYETAKDIRDREACITIIYDLIIVIVCMFGVGYFGYYI